MIYVSVVGYGVQSYPHPNMKRDGWQFMRIEYWDSKESFAFLEHHVWMPPGVSSAMLEDWMQEAMDRGSAVPVSV